LLVVVVLAGSLSWASLTCSFWDNYGAYWAAAPVAVAAMAAVYLRQSEPETTVDLVFGLCVGIAAGSGTFYGVSACSLAFAHCG
jgi:hypothetical protein